MAGLVLLIMFLIMILLAALDHLRSLQIVAIPLHHFLRLGVEDINDTSHHFWASLCTIRQIV